MAYNVLLTTSASRELEGLSHAARDRVLAVLAGLTSDPRPHGCVKLKVASGDAWRVRAGDYRILYAIDDQAREVRVFRIRHRRDAYRSL
jgi:mRNA interferase RelE/StbE